MRVDMENIKKYKKMPVNDSNPWLDTCGMLYDAINTWGDQGYYGISHDDWWKAIKFDKNEKMRYNILCQEEVIQFTSIRGRTFSLPSRSKNEMKFLKKIFKTS